MQDADLVVGIHGTIEMIPWVRRAQDADVLDADAFGLIVERSESLGLAATTVAARRGANRLWDHADAGGDWAQGSTVRELSWLHVVLGEPTGPRRRLPIQAVALVQLEALRRIGTVAITGAHALVPLRIAADSGPELAASREWFAFADPASRTDLAVSVYSGNATDARDHAGKVAGDVSWRTQDVVTCELAEGGRFPRRSLATEPTAWRSLGTRRTPHGAVFSCSVPEWSAELASWMIELFADAYRASGSTKPVVIAVAAVPG